MTDTPKRLETHHIAALAALTLLGIYLCWRLAEPFIPALAWAAALAVMGWPLHRRLARNTSRRSLAAALSTFVVCCVIAGPVLLVSLQLVDETQRAVAFVKQETADDQWRAKAARVPYVGETLSQMNIDELQSQARALGERLAGGSGSFAGGVADFTLQLLVAVFALFFCFRDADRLLEQIQQLIPLDRPNSKHILKRAEDAIHATVYGTLLTAILQGASGGLLFWALGLPAPVLWGAVMVVLGIIPFLGAFIVWIPAAAYLISCDCWPQALILAAWGVVMAGPVANYLYATAAGDRLRLHPIPTLIAFIGGLAVFGVSGMVLGPCVLAVTLALIDVWRDDPAPAIVEL